MKTKKIGSFKPENPYLLAPMEEVNDIAFRLLCKKAGAGLTYTGMVNPLSRQKLYLDDRPALQLFGVDERGIEDFIRKYEDKVSLFDFNLGCPAKTARRHGFGAFLHPKINVIERILKTMRESTKKPVTIKLRKSKHALKIVRLAEQYCDAVCIHPRTQIQGYSGIPDIEFAEKIKSISKIPVIYSGDVTKENADFLLKEKGFDFVMIGRKAIGNPNIFSELAGKRTDIRFKDYLELAEKYNLPFRQIKFQAMCFTKSMRGAKEKRLEIFKCRKIDDLKKITPDIF